MTTFKAQKDGKLSDEILNAFNGAVSYANVMKLLRKKDVKINGKRVNKDEKVMRGDQIQVYADVKDTRADNVIFSDDNLLVCVKPKGITSEDFYKLVKANNPSAIFTHRLDRNTDGIMLFALNEESFESLLNGFKNRTFKKYYYTEVVGIPQKKQATLTAYLKKNAEKSTVKIYDSPICGAEKIITKYDVLSTFSQTSALSVELVTGKTHQIRAHLAHIGHPIIGDGKYGNKSINEQFRKKSQILTAYKLTLKFAKDDYLGYLNGKTFEIKPTHTIKDCF